MSDDISEIVRQLRTGEAIDRTAIAATLERLSADVTQQADALRQENKEIERLRAEIRQLQADVIRAHMD